MGPAGLTAVFGMGTGVTPPVWSPENPAGRAVKPGRRISAMVGHDESIAITHTPWGIVGTPHDPVRIGELCGGHRPIGSPLGCGGPIGVVKLLGC